MIKQLLSTISLVAAVVITFCWMFWITSRLDTLEHKTMILEGQNVAQQGLVEGMYFDDAAEVDPAPRLETLEEQVEAIQGAIAVLLREASLRISPKD